jgi:membrane protein DedA with SNARE-associated domain
VHVLQADAGGLVGWVLDVVESLGALGVAALVLLETVLPPIPSEVVLPLAGFLVQQDRLSLLAVLVATTTASVLGALLLYGAGRALGGRRTRAILVRVPLVEHQDVDRAEEWFDRRGEVAVLVGRLVPGVRSLVSLPAGTRRMPVGRFVLLTAVGSGTWNTPGRGRDGARHAVPAGHRLRRRRRPAARRGGGRRRRSLRRAPPPPTRPGARMTGPLQSRVSLR